MSVVNRKVLIQIEKKVIRHNHKNLFFKNGTLVGEIATVKAIKKLKVNDVILPNLHQLVYFALKHYIWNLCIKA
jgi:hypothetical protein